MKAYRYTVNDRIRVEIEHDGVPIAVDLAVLAVEVEPDQSAALLDAIGKEPERYADLTQFCVHRMCKIINQS